MTNEMYPETGGNTSGDCATEYKGDTETFLNGQEVLDQVNVSVIN